MLKRTILTAGSLILMTAATTGDAQAADPENTIYMRLSTGGTVTMELLPDLAPQHVERIKTLAREGFYDGIIFHRVIDGFMAQTGDPQGTGMGGSDLPDLPAEFSDYDYKRGTVGMARTQDPNSANSQFFICFTDTGCSFLTGQYTVLAQVTDGMNEIDKVAKGEPPANPDKIEKMFVAADMQPETTAETQAAPAETPAAEEPTMAEEAVDTAADAAEATGEAVQDAAEVTGETVQDAAEATGEMAEDAAEATGDAVEDLLNAEEKPAAGEAAE
ncbi:MAG: peptidylprolyl isomerase [Alphaproteobacteria bacterium]|nr:peptidylprolyl isomerase [Alphaproteobacteria bacterium]